ncbi:MAG TPA: TA system VapC family ribonuclease toxin [Mycobacterium sp.]|nr:TA system VapC family ribonuclease toxin [Mycobacterium sp.]
MAGTTFLADANVLIALVVRDHVHHGAAMRWFRREKPTLYLCPFVEGALLRMLIQQGHRGTDGAALLARLYRDGRHSFVADSMSYSETNLSSIVGHRQVTDTYLAALARSLGIQLATFDAGLREAHRDVVIAIPT